MRAVISQTTAPLLMKNMCIAPYFKQAPLFLRSKITVLASAVSGSRSNSSVLSESPFPQHVGISMGLDNRQDSQGILLGGTNVCKPAKATSKDQDILLQVIATNVCTEI